MNQTNIIEQNYNKYWQKRKTDNQPIPDNVPSFLKSYTAYGSILNEIPTGSVILDVGCGDGSVTQLYINKGKVTGIDISKEALKYAQRRKIHTIKHDLNNLPYPFPKNSFDAITITDVLEHLLDPISILKELNRLLKSDGRLIVTVPNFARIGNRFKMFWGDPTDLLHFSKYGDSIEHLQWFTKPKLNEYFRISGFKKVKYLATGLQSGHFLFGKLGLPELGNFLTAVAYKN
jgi:methionine biosynthesis protein MetW